MKIILLTEVLVDLPDYCQYKDCRKPSSNLVGLGKNGEQNGSHHIISVCKEHLNTYLNTELYALVPEVVELNQGFVRIEEK